MRWGIIVGEVMDKEDVIELLNDLGLTKSEDFFVVDSQYGVNQGIFLLKTGSVRWFRDES
jgi:hypothetical protein